VDKILESLTKASDALLAIAIGLIGAYIFTAKYLKLSEKHKFTLLIFLISGIILIVILKAFGPVVLPAVPK
jgi:hypothetical protein